MKKTTYFFLSCALLTGSLLTGCSSDEPLRAPAPAPEGVAASRSVADAEAIALALAEGRQGESRFGEQVFVDGVVALTTPGSRSGLADTLIYAVNYADNKGFALIAAPVAAEPIIGFTEQGSFDEETAAENPAFSFYLDAAKSYAASKISIGGGGITIDPSKPIETTEVTRPRIWVSWGQRYPEGIYCPNGISGCVQTAMAQMMTYIGKPTSMTYTFEERDINCETINWTTLSQHYLSLNVSTYTNNPQIDAHLSSCEAAEAAHKTIGRICRQLGKLNNAAYLPQVTLSNVYIARNTFASLLPQNDVSSVCSFSEANYESIYDFLATHSAVALIAGTKSGASYGHAWVCDGGKRIKVTQKVALAGGGYETIELSCKSYFSFNWGWCGQYNGYFLAGVFDPTNNTTNGEGAYNSSVIYFYVQK